MIGVKIRTLFVLTIVLIDCVIAQQNTEKVLPNIVYVFADDLGYGDLSSFGAKDINTPHIDRIAKEGILFTDFYSASPLCSPSRAALLTGRYPQRMGINDVFYPESFTGMPKREITIAELLKEKGYVSAIIGKCQPKSEVLYMDTSNNFNFGHYPANCNFSKIKQTI